MKNSDIDIFETASKTSGSGEDVNPFSEDENPFLNLFEKKEPVRRLNDYDSNILKDGAYKDINDDTFKLECKISKAEEEIKSIESQIEVASAINDSQKTNELRMKLYALNDEYRTLLDLYNEKTLSAKIVDSVSNVFDNAVGANISNFNNQLSKTFESVMSKMPLKIFSLLKIRKSLNILENINKSVDKLVTMATPYGENIDKYQQLSKYIIKANSIQAEISNYLEKK